MTKRARRSLAACLATLLSSGFLLAQTIDAPAISLNSSQSPYSGSVTTVQATGNVEPISLDDAIRMGVEHNLGLVEARAQQKAAQGHVLDSLQPLLPAIRAQASTGAHQYNLAARGFSGGVLKEFSHLLPGTNFSNVKVDTTQAAVSYSQTLFDLSTIYRYRAAKQSAVSAAHGTLSARGLVILTAGDAYLEALAAGARVDNARALLRADRLSLQQAIEKHRAGTTAKLDELRARVTYQNQQQALIAAQNAFAKGKIALNREIGLPPEQQIQLTDAVPYAPLAAMSIEQARRIAYQNRQVYLRLLSQIHAARLQSRAAKWERLPSLTFSGNYGVTGVTGGLYHGTFAAVGSINLPIFQEARFRGDQETAAANLASLTDQLSDLKQKIDQQLRDSMLDVQSTGEVVRVAQSNVDLARQELEQTRERYSAGVTDNLPVVNAQARLAAAESQLIDSTMQYNEAKLGLARNLGLIESQFGVYLPVKQR